MTPAEVAAFAPKVTEIGREGRIWLPLHGVEVRLLTLPSYRRPPEEVTSAMAAALTTLLAVGQEGTDALAALLHRSAEDCFVTTGWGFDVFAGESETDANRREFGIHSPADALREAGTPTLQLRQAEERDDAAAVMIYDAPWDDHGVGVVWDGTRFGFIDA